MLLVLIIMPQPILLSMFGAVCVGSEGKIESCFSSAPFCYVVRGLCEKSVLFVCELQFRPPTQTESLSARN